MFWRVAGYSQASPIESILDKDSFTLEELLDEDDLIQECKSLNDRLVAFLRTPETVLKLIDYIVVPPDDEAMQDDKKRIKYPFSACEIFCCEVDGILTAMLDGDAPLDRLYTLLDERPPLNCVMAGYFTRVLTSLLVKRSQDVLQHLQQHQGLLTKLISHVSNASMAEMLVRLVGADENLAMYMNPGHLSWQTETPLMSALVDKLSPPGTTAENGVQSTSEVDIDVQKHAAGVLAAIAHNHECPLTVIFTDPDYLQQLFARAFAPSDSMQALDVCLALLEQRQARPDNASNTPDSPTGREEHLDMQIKDATVQGLLAHLARLTEILDRPGPLANSGPHVTPYGELRPPLGINRLKGVELVGALLRAENPAADAGVTECGALRQCLQLFRQYPFHSLLHAQVTGMVLHALDSGDDSPVLTHLLGPGDLLHWLFSAPPTLVEADDTAVHLAGKAGSSRAQPATGWMGHVTRMGNKLAEAAGRREDVAAALGASKEWSQWADAVLRPRNERENVMQWSCGRPSMSELATSLEHSEPDSGLMQDLGEDPPEGAPLTHAAAKAASTGSSASATSHRYGSFDAADDDDDDDISGFQGQADITLDAAAAFRNLNLTRAASGGDSSSSDDDSDSGPSHNTMMDDDTVMVSTHDVDGEDADSALSGSLNFADFDAFPSSPPTAHEAAKVQESSSEGSGVSTNQPPPTFGSWSFASNPNANATSSSDDAGWAVFDEPVSPSPYSSDHSPQSFPVNIPFPGRGSAGGTTDSRTSQHDAFADHSEGDLLADVQPSAMAAPEFNAFTYWRPPPDELVEMEPEDDHDLVAHQPSSDEEQHAGSSSPAHDHQQHQQPSGACLAIRPTPSPGDFRPVSSPAEAAGHAIREASAGDESAAGNGRQRSDDAHTGADQAGSS